ncbi:MAG: serine/threonine-protein kinase, partial [Gemmatimonadales bacterium]
MDEAREERLEQLFAAAAALPPEDRPAFLEAKCGADPSLRAELASLLADAGEADGFLDRVAGPVVVRAAEAFTDQSEGTVLTMSPDLDRLNTALSDRYAVEREIGRGGMATVYLAEDLKHSRQVAIKVLRPDLAATLGAERFLNEIRTIANLHHPHILSLHDSGEADSFLYYVMPYVAGESLREKLDREKQLPVEEAVRIASEVAEALEYAHGREVTHRDIKPANILLHEGRALVTDFGIAIALGASGGERLTETGLSVGTPQYMSPEQARGDWEPDGRSDLYSLGCVLYEMLTGEPPHTGVSAQAIIRKIVTEDVQPATELRESVPPKLIPLPGVARRGDWCRRSSAWLSWQGAPGGSCVRFPRFPVDQSSSSSNPTLRIGSCLVRLPCPQTVRFSCTPQGPTRDRCCTDDGSMSSKPTRLPAQRADWLRSSHQTEPSLASVRRVRSAGFDWMEGRPASSPSSMATCWGRTGGTMTRSCSVR